ncbi:MAG: DEAD/DEAH box helicase family protein, partial [Cyclobacteriaceae bacterium]|nr:DEAD/DEAH box helicase family protein [Cyclobacteriaceae bacterium]
MVDFKELLGKKELTLEIEPISIFNDLDQESDKSFIRPPQEKILEKWYNDFRDQKDTIVKLPTGQGKTLIGLLILQSFLNENEGPVVYICPNNYLVEQTIKQAESFGIKTTKVGVDNRIPLSYLNSEAILVATCKKIFNGKSQFGVEGTSDYRHIGAMVMDDAHKCLEIIRESFSIRINRFKNDAENPIYNAFWSLFLPSLLKQGKGTCMDIDAGRNCSLAVPFWVWQESESAVLDILNQYRDDSDIFFTWDLIKDN